MQIFSFFFFLLILSILPPDNIIYVNGKILRKKDKHVKQERIDMSMATVAGAMYPKIKQKAKKADQERKKLQYKAQKKLREPQKIKEKFDVKDYKFMKFRQIYEGKIKQAKFDILHKDLNLQLKLNSIRNLMIQAQKELPEVMEQIETSLNEQQHEEEIKQNDIKKQQSSQNQEIQDIQELEREITEQEYRLKLKKEKQFILLILLYINQKQIKIFLIYENIKIKQQNLFYFINYL